MVFWMAWVIIPLAIEIFPALSGFWILLRKKKIKENKSMPIKFPEITLIIPVYNSSDTLKECLESIYDSTYPKELIDIILVNNMSQDDSFKVFTDCQKQFEALSMCWINAKQGKSKALNMALFSSKGKYILHIDSDGKLEKHAVEHMVTRFEQHPEIHCMTGSILTDFEKIEATPQLGLRYARRCEFFEYAQAFLAGRNYESEKGRVYTLSGAFSAFRKSTILKTNLYNSMTVCEDTHISFQVRGLLKKNIYLCEKALFFVDPIDNWGKLYTQRQRWQRGELEVAHMFFKDKLLGFKGICQNFAVRLLLYDHTFAFPRMIWYFALLFLVFKNYSMGLVLGSLGLIYLLYCLSGFLFYLNVLSYMKDYKEIRRYYQSKSYILLLMPFFNFLTFWIRLAGIINCITTRGTWKTATLGEEWANLTQIVHHDFKGIIGVINKIREWVNNE